MPKRREAAIVAKHKADGAATPANWFLYVIECADGALYAGIALDPLARFEQHRAGKGAKYTRANRPVRLLGKIAYPDRGSATRAEIAFKRLNKAEKLARIPEFQRSDPA